MKQFIFKNINIFLGENKEENWNLLETSNENDFFVHLNSFPSGHVKIETEMFNQEIIRHAGEICKQNSKYKILKNLKICYCKYSNVFKGKKMGEVVFKSNRQIKTIKLN
jgi:predicted ribosome quality control (RQC) complex YloA/Tae2 family protein